MGHLFSRAIKRFTQCSGAGRNSLPSSNSGNNEQQATRDASQRGKLLFIMFLKLNGTVRARVIYYAKLKPTKGYQFKPINQQRIDQDSARETVQSIPVGQSIDSAEYAAFKTTSSSFEDRTGQDNSAIVAPQGGQLTASAAGVNDDKENDENVKKQEIEENDLVNNDENKPQVEEAVIKIQALVRGHLTRKALKDAQQQAAVVPPNALGQSQFDEESLRNPPNAVFSNASSPATSTNSSNSNNNNSNNNNQQSNKMQNNRVPPLESIAEDVESTNQSNTNSTREKRKPLSPLNQSSGSASDSTGESGEPHSISPSTDAQASIDLHCDTPASVSIDIMDHTSKPMPGIASVLHHRDPLEHERETSTTDQSEHNRQILPETFRMPNLAAFQSSIDDRHTMNASSLPSSPPHINLAAATTNSHSIDSAEAAAIRIQSAFRGYHTRKHSPYRRRSPASASSPLARPVRHQLNGTETNGQPKRNTLRQQDATIQDEDDDEGVEGCERLTEALGANEENIESLGCSLVEVEQDNEENRQSRQRHRADEPLASGDPKEQTSVKNTVSMSIDEITKTDDQSTVKELRSDASRAIGDGAAEARWSTSLDTDSSNLGAALSLNEDLSEGISQLSQGRDAVQQMSQQRESSGAAVDAATDELEAALEEATDKDDEEEANFYGDQLAEDLADKILEDETEQNLNELESDDIERRHPSGLVGEISANSLSELGQQPALVASNSLDEGAQQQALNLAEQPSGGEPRLDVISPDEAIGSGESSPVPLASNDGNSSDDGADSDQDQEGQQHQQERGEPSDGPSKTDNNQQGGGGKGKKRNRNKKKGKK